MTCHVDGWMGEDITGPAGAFLFDLDGTLVDSVKAVEAAWTEWADVAGVILPAKQHLHGRTADAIAGSLLRPEQVRSGARQLTEIEERTAGLCLPRQGAIEFVYRLPARNWAIVTSARRSVALARLRAAGVPVPSVLVTSESVGMGKPAPDPFLLALELLGGLSGPTFAFEDAPAGLEAARAAGCFTFALRGTAPEQELQSRADRVISSFQDLQLGVDDGNFTLVSSEGTSG